MLSYKEYKCHQPRLYEKDGKLYDATIYTFDIETTNLIEVNGIVECARNYLKYDESKRDDINKYATMYIFMLGINDVVYYGRTWSEFLELINKINETEGKKIFYVHNFAFEFQFLKSILNFEDVFARAKHKVIYANCCDYNIEFRCSLFLSNCSLERVPDVFKLDVKKQVGLLDYDKLRHSKTILTDDELKYCEYDCLVLYEYIKKELEDYKTLTNIPKTSTGKVRRELLDKLKANYKYKAIVRKSINTDPHVYNLLVEAFAGGYTHANYINAGEVIKDVNSYDIASSYPYTLVAKKFPSTEFKRASVTNANQMSNMCAYILVVRFFDLKCRYFNNFISQSKCRLIKGGRYDNGRVIEAEALEIVLTDIDFKFILKSYDCRYQIVESYYSFYKYLPKDFVLFVLDKYVKKTELKNVDGCEYEYTKNKNMFNSLYGMAVTNLIRNDVIYNTTTKDWSENELTNDEIIARLNKEKGKAFLNFATGVWVTAHARASLLYRIIELDEYMIYADTDSAKLIKGYDKGVFERYNASVMQTLKEASEHFNIPLSKFAPKDKLGIEHPLGVFELETKKGREYTYDEFKTEGAKKYAYKIDGKIGITIAGVPKEGAKCLKKVDDLDDGLIFPYEITGKLTHLYTEAQPTLSFKDENGVIGEIQDESAVVLLPATYNLKKSIEYASLLTTNSSARAKYKE